MLTNGIGVSLGPGVEGDATMPPGKCGEPSTPGAEGARARRVVTAPRPPRAPGDQAVTWMLSPGFITCTFTLGAMAATARRNSSPAWMPITWGLWA